MAEEPVDTSDVLDTIERVKRALKENAPNLQEHIYNGMNSFSTTLLAYKDAEGRPGWSAGLTQPDGTPMWSETQQNVLEETLPHMIETKQQVQQGGALGPRTLALKSTAEGTLVQPKLPIDPSLISLDGAFYKIRDMLQDLDDKNRELARILGPTAIINGMTTDPGIGPMPPYLPIRLSLPARAILPLINSILESLRLFLTVSLTDSSYDKPLLRQILSVVLAIFDISRGEWRDGVLSLLGVYSRNALLSGVFLKTVRWVYNFISPDIQARIEEDVWSGGKSMVVGGWLWLFSIVAPDFVRAQFTALIERAKLPIEQINEKLAQVEEKAQQEAAKVGALVQFPRIPLESIPSFDDIQNLQSLLHQPAVFCNPAFQQLLAPALQIPPLRIALELMNIPTLPEKIAEYCKDEPKDVADAVVKQLTPTILPATPVSVPAALAPVTKGGTRSRRQKRRSRPLQRTRRRVRG